MTIESEAAEVLHFWFVEVGPDRQFLKDDALDAECARRFGALRDAVLADEAREWRGSADVLLAAIILLDQISRNIFRDSAEAFAADPLALELTLSGIAAGFDRSLPPDRRAFFYMPLMHSEDRGVQRFAQRCFAQEGLAHNLDFARAHRDVIERFGRFPSRNAALGRTTTAEESAWMEAHGAGW